MEDASGFVGDGANDVSMIQTADVGIGISGQEGMQVRTTTPVFAEHVPVKSSSTFEFLFGLPH